MLKIKMSELRAALRKLRAEHSGKAVGRMTADELSREISHHETACKAREMKEKRMASLEKAREARSVAKKVEVGEKKVVKAGKKDEKLGEEVETIKSRMVKKKPTKNE
jgi:hypothetical protein